MKRALYPGSFDPITKGHLDIIRRSKDLFDELTIGVLINSEKQNPWFTTDEKLKMIKKVLEDENIEAKVEVFDGLLVDFIEKRDINVLIRGLRAVSDYEYELQIFLTNKAISRVNFETVFLISSREYLYLSSSVVREIAMNKGDLNEFVPKSVNETIIEKIKSEK